MMICSLKPIGWYRCVKNNDLSKEVVTKTVGNGLRVDILVDTQDANANENGQEIVRKWLQMV